jgi:putative DNA primase/helicase
MIGLGQTEDGIPVRPGELDQDRFSLNCQNGTVSLRTGKVCPHRAGDLLTKITPVSYDPRAACPTFDGFIDRIMGSDNTLIQYLQRCIGYALTGDISEQVMFVLFGSGANGKTTLLEAVRHILGEYAVQVPVRTLMIKRGDGVSNDIARLKGLRFVTASEVEAGQRLAEAQVKQLTGGGTLQARFLYHEPFEFEPTHKLFMDCNHKPEIRGTDEAIWRRIRLIPFNVSVPEGDRDKNLLQKLKAEGRGILAWAVRGCLAWQQEGLGEPTSAQQAMSEYREEMDIVAEFVRDECTLRVGARETSDALYSAFTRWCQNRQEQPVSQKAFGARLSEMQDVGAAKSGGSRFRTGIMIRRETEEAA